MSLDPQNWMGYVAEDFLTPNPFPSCGYTKGRGGWGAVQSHPKPSLENLFTDDTEMWLYSLKYFMILMPDLIKNVNYASLKHDL